MRCVRRNFMLHPRRTRLAINLQTKTRALYKYRASEPASESLANKLLATTRSLYTFRSSEHAGVFFAIKLQATARSLQYSRSSETTDASMRTSAKTVVHAATSTDVYYIFCIETQL
jgi:hypothetical protein